MAPKSVFETTVFPYRIVTPAVPSAPPREIRCTAQSAHSLKVDWEAPEQSMVNGVIQGYKLLYEPADDDESAASAGKFTFF